jgi:hypothetical protein
MAQVGGDIMKLTLKCAAACAFGASLLVPPRSLCGQAPPTLRLTRELRIDAAANDLTLVTPPGGIAVSSQGTIAVTQNQDGAIRFFDAQGNSLGTFGRKGLGPGEFQTFGRFMWVGDTLVVSDGATRRHTLISPDRKLVRSVAWPAAVTVPGRAGGEAPRVRTPLPRARYSDGSLLLPVSLATGSGTPDWPGGEKPGTPFIRVDSTGAFQRLIVWSLRAQCDVQFDSGDGPTSGTLIIPFCHQTLEEVSTDGNLLVLVSKGIERPSEFRVSAFRANGDIVFSQPVAFQSVPIPKSVADSARAARARGTQGQRDAAAKMPIPETYPPFSRLIVGRDESIWIESFGPGAERYWFVLDNRGTVTGKATVPGNVQLMVVSRMAVWGIETDADGLQHVVRFRVAR